ncbi:hypothetical protein GQ55_8G200800 [Panicum hallii var. hallii]|uniref:Knottin scorpion toxin-like domain-containing protein n=2 Tax=Panicum hallii TaxID=206008 RepID=A0A2T7CPA0_9POAL|nr:hypothetical protein PAHAL_8G204900 [Panicum hallii]PUZ45169.1 hypothetical protein GQ55_8G200800 [Panicum hallii var. hallii]
MATRIMYLTAAVFLALSIMSTTIPSSEAGGRCSKGRCLPPPPRPLPPPASFRCFQIRRDEPACKRPKDCENLCAKNDYPKEHAYCRSRRECCCKHPVAQ